MPIVGKKEFSYSEKGVEQAKEYAQKTGKKLTKTKKTMTSDGFIPKRYK